MKPITFEDVNAFLHDERHGDLPAHKGDGFYITRWRPSWRERFSMLIFGNVWVALLSDKHPPLAVYGGRAAHFVLDEA